MVMSWLMCFCLRTHRLISARFLLKLLRTITSLVAVPAHLKCGDRETVTSGCSEVNAHTSLDCQPAVFLLIQSEVCAYNQMHRVPESLSW